MLTSAQDIATHLHDSATMLRRARQTGQVVGYVDRLQEKLVLDALAVLLFEVMLVIGARLDSTLRSFAKVVAEVRDYARIMDSPNDSSHACDHEWAKHTADGCQVVLDIEEVDHGEIIHRCPCDSRTGIARHQNLRPIERESERLIAREQEDAEEAARAAAWGQIYEERALEHNP